MDRNSLLRQIPKVDELLTHPVLATLGPGAVLTAITRQALDELRNDIHHGGIEKLPNLDIIAREISQRLNQYLKPNLRRVINGTGIILHTNLGRAPLAKEALEAVAEAARDYSNLEYSITEGRRDSRHAIIEDLLVNLTGAQGAMVVNNNAAAVLLALSAVAQHKDVIVSRGELVEIGGSFRIPDVMAQSGCRLVEVGTTNKTHLADYEKAIAASGINENYAIGPSSNFTGAVLRVHTSNFVVSGFVKKPTLTQLSSIAAKYAVPLIEDLGSGCMISLEKYGIHGQPVVADSIKAGVGIVTFSGDKLLGGPQAGIILGRKEHIAKMKAHPLARAMRIDKLCLAALEATLRLYLYPETVVKKIPALRMLCEKPKALFRKAQYLESVLKSGDPFPNPEGNDTAPAKKPAWEITVVEETSQAGGGAMPEEDFTSAAVAISSNVSAQAIERHFRSGPVPIVGRISRDRFLLDVRTLNTEDFPVIAARLLEMSETISHRLEKP